MSGRPKSEHYSEMRNVAEGLSRGKTRLKRELVPGIATWIMMLSKYYLKCAEGMANAACHQTVPGHKEAAERMIHACQHLQWLMDAIPRPFNRRDWEDAAREVCLHLQINPAEMPLYDIADDSFCHIVKGIPDASGPDGEGSDLEPSIQHAQGAADTDGGAPSGRPGLGSDDTLQRPEPGESAGLHSGAKPRAKRGNRARKR